MLRSSLGLLVVLLILVAAPAAQAAEVLAREGDSGRRISMVRGDVLRVHLRENPSTGFSWRTAVRPAQGVLRQLSNRFVAPPATTPPTVGAPGRRQVTWRAVGRGTTRFTLRLIPPGGGSGTRSFRLTVVVR